MRRLALLALLSTLLGTAAALAQGTDPTAAPPPAPTPPAAPTPEAEPSPEETARRAQVVAKIGPVEVTLGELEDEINRQSPFMRARYRDRAALRTFVEERIRFELIAREADRRHFGERPEVLAETRQAYVQQLIRRDFD